MDKRVRFIIGLIGSIIFVYGIWYFRGLVSYMIISVAVSIAGQPVMSLLGKVRIKNHTIGKGFSAFITLLFIWTVVISFFSIFIPLIISEANILSSVDVTALFHNLEKPLTDIFEFMKKAGIFDSQSSFESYITSKVIDILKDTQITHVLGSLTSVLGNILMAFFVISFFTFFFLKDSDLFSNGILLFVPDKHTKEVENILSSIKVLLSRYLSGIVLEVLLVMALVTLGLWLVGIEFQHALVCGMVSGILNVIPYIGPWIGAAFSITIGIAINTNMPFQPELLSLIGLMVLVFAIVQALDNIVFQPLIYSNTVNAHPLEIFLVIIMAGSIAGIGGMILAIPSYTVLRVIAKEFFSSFKVVQKITKNI